MRTPKPRRENKCGKPEIAGKIDLDQVTKLAGIGMGVKSIAVYLGVGRRTLDRYIAERPEVKEAMDKGNAIGQKRVLGYLCKAMENGSVPAIIFYMVNKFPDEWQSVNKGFNIVNNNENTNGQFGQIIAKDKEAGEMVTKLVQRLSDPKRLNAIDGK